MKYTNFIFFLFIILFSVGGKIRSQSMLWDEQYTETVFLDEFNGTELDHNKWVVDNFKKYYGPALIISYFSAQ